MRHSTAPLRPEHRVVLLALGAAPLLYWVFMTRIAAVEPVFNLVLIAPFVAACFALGVVEVLGQRLAVLAFPIVALSFAQIVTQHGAWQQRLYSHNAKGAVRLGKIVQKVTHEGDVLIEDGSSIGPGILAFYPRRRTVINSENFLLVPRPTAAEYVSHILGKLAPQRSVYLVTTADRLESSDLVAQFGMRGYEFVALAESGEWLIFRIRKRA